MTLLRAGVQALVRQNTERPPQGGMGFGGSFSGSGLLGGVSSLFEQLRQPANSPWLYAVIDRIARSVAMTEWSLEEQRPNGETRQVFAHPALSLWQQWNPWTETDEGLEIIQQHLSLVGEAWMVLLRNNNGVPVEIWPVRPDRMEVLPDTRNYIRGYRYRIGAVTIDLDVDDVLFIRRPSPIDPYRGAGPVASLLVDMQGEKAAAQWNAAFFRNSAEPGGVIEFDEQLSDPDFERLVARWNAQHQGVGNAHRVAIVEGGEWKDRKLSMRDMQFEQLRKYNRDLILGAYGFPRSILGMTEGVNRATAEAANYVFARWVVLPELMRIKSAVNARLIARYGSPGLRLVFVDPTPENRELAIREAEVGAETGALTTNEIRRRLGEESTTRPEDDEPRDPPMRMRAVSEPAQVETRLADPADIKPDTVESAEAEMAEAWERRLGDELSAIIAHLEPFATRNVRRQDPPRITHQKIELPDVDSYNWAWAERYGDEVAEELQKAFRLALVAEVPEMVPSRVQMLAAEWARLRAGDLLADSGPFSLVEGTRDAVKTAVSDALESGAPLREIETELRNGYHFSRRRAVTVARTETAGALGQGQKRAALEQGRDEKRWVSQGDETVCPICRPNVAQGWIGISEEFASGHDTVPGHAACRCVAVYRTKAVHESRLGLVAEARCEQGHLVGRQITPGLHWCRHCARNVLVEGDGLQLSKMHRVMRDEYGRLQGVEELGG